MIKYELIGRLQLGVLAATAILLVAYSLGAFRVSLDLINTDNRFIVSTRGAEGEATMRNGAISARCHFPDNVSNNYCILVIMTSNSLSSGVDLSGYDQVVLDLTYSGLDKHKNLLLYFWNFNPEYSVETDDNTLKFNALSFIPNRNRSLITLDLDNLSVPTWWLSKNELGHEHSGAELDNVASMQISLDYNIPAGDYEITLGSAVLTGQRVSPATLLSLGGSLFLAINLWGLYLRRLSKNQLAHRDLLTGQLNRKGLLAWVNDEIKNRPKQFIHANTTRTLENGNNDLAIQQAPCHDYLAMLYIDLDDFKKINDTYGHRIGDLLLLAICERVSSHIENQQLLKINESQCAFARLSGDEFCLAVNGLKAETIDDFAKALLRLMTTPFILDALQIKVHASIGLALYSGETGDAESLLHQADLAMYHSKRNGKNQYYNFDYKLQELIELKKTISVALKAAIEKQDFEIAFMPIYESESGKISGAEVLLRTNNPVLKDVGPETFIPIAEEYGFIRDIDLWVVERTFQRMSDFPKLFQELQIRLAINISSVELHNAAFIERLQALLQRYAIKPSFIELEITETSLSNVDDRSIDMLKSLQALGIQLALDDFGTGYTGFNQLLHYPVDVVKIDRSFIARLSERQGFDTTMVDAILSIARSYELKVVAEGVETQEQANYLKKNGCEMLQGFYLSRPLTWEGFMQALNSLPQAGGGIAQTTKKNNVKPIRALQTQET